MSVYAQRMFDLGFGVTVMKHDLNAGETLPSVVCEYNTGKPIEFSVKREDSVLGIYVPNNVNPLITLEGTGAWSGYNIEDYKVDCSVSRNEKYKLCDLNFKVSLKKEKLILIHFTLPYEDSNVYNWFFGDAKITLSEEKEEKSDDSGLLIKDLVWTVKYDDDSGVIKTTFGEYKLVIIVDKKSRKLVTRTVCDSFDEPTILTCEEGVYDGGCVFCIRTPNNDPIALLPYSDIAPILNNYRN